MDDFDMMQVEDIEAFADRWGDVDFDFEEGGEF